MAKILMVVDELAEDLELYYPYYRLMEEGHEVVMASSVKEKEYKGKYGVPYISALSYEEVVLDDYSGLLIPGGWAPDKIRRYEIVLDMVRYFNDKKKPIGQICHAGWVSISAGIIKGRKVTSTPGIKDDMINAGGIWENVPVVCDQNLVSSRWPKDLPQYMQEYIAVLNDFLAQDAIN